MSKFGTQIDPISDLLIGEFTPKNQNRFMLSFADSDYSLPAFLIKSISRPTITTNATEYKYGGKIVHFAGGVTYGEISMTLVDPIDISASAKVMEWIYSIHDPVTAINGYPKEYKKDLTINVLGPYGEMVDEWTIRGAFPTSVNFSDASSDSDEFHTIELTLTIDDVIWEY